MTNLREKLSNLSGGLPVVGGIFVTCDQLNAGLAACLTPAGGDRSGIHRTAG